MIEKLNVYKKAYDVSLVIHKLTLDFPKLEQIGGIADQLRRSSKSIVANLVEGYALKNIYPAKFKSYLVNSIASNDETKLWLNYAKDLSYI